MPLFSRQKIERIQSVVSMVLIILLVLAMVIWTPWLVQVIFNFISMMTALVVFSIIYFTVKMVKEVFKVDKD